MSLIGALQVGKSALATHQAAIQVTSNNIANAGNADYTRQTARVTPAFDRELRPGVFVGTGINLDSIQRQIDEALQGRLRGSVSDNQSAEVMQQWFSRVESVFNELGDQDLSSRLSTFFNSWSDLANKPQDIGLRQVVIQNGQSVSDWFNDLRTQFSNLEVDVDARLNAMAKDADQLAQQIADLNGTIVITEGGGAGQANALRDQRDVLLGRLAQQIDIRTIDQPNGVVNVYVGSEPLVMNTENRGVALRQETVDGQLTADIIFKANGGEMKLTSGQLGALNEVRSKIGDIVDTVDSLASNLIFELNSLHASGQGLEGFSSVTATNAVDDINAPLNDAGLPFTPKNGSFVVHVTHRATGLTTSSMVQVDLDGLNGNDTTLDSLRNALDLDGTFATIAGGKLTLGADSVDAEISFSQDSSGILSALGLNSFFTGTNANDISVNQVIKDQPSLLSAAKNGQPGDNQTARAIAALELAPISSLNGVSLKDSYQAMINGVAVAADMAKTNSEASRVVKETLEAQREALSGVSLDEEAINLIRQQRAFQGAARVIAAVDEMMRTLLTMA